MLEKITLAAGETQEFNEEADFFRLLEATDTVTLIFYFSGREVAKAEKIKEGYSEKFLVSRFNKIVIKNESTGPQTLQFVTRLGNEVEYNKNPVGDVNVKNSSGSNFVRQQYNNQTGNWLAVYSNQARRYISIYNNGNSNIGLGLGSLNNFGDASFVLKPKETFFMEQFVTTGPIYAIPESGSMSYVVTEGYA